MSDREIWRAIDALRAEVDQLRAIEQPYLAAGTGFPTDGLYDGRPWLRPDLGISWAYDLANSRWLSDERALPLGFPNALVPLAAAGTVGQAPVDRGRFSGVRYTRAVCRTRVLTTNDNANYWTIVLRESRSDGTTTDLWTFDTRVFGVATSTISVQNVDTDATASPSAHLVFVVCTPTGAPGTLSIQAGLSIRYIAL